MEYLVFLYFTLNVLYLVTLSFCGYLVKKKDFPSSRFSRIAILIPAYKEDQVILNVIKKIVDLDYPSLKFDIYLIADSFEEKTLDIVNKYRIKLMTVAFENSTKTKSLNYAFNQIQEDYDIALILDADNVPNKNYLRKINDAFNAGFEVIQTQRVGKNLGSSVAYLDAVSEAINNHLFRKSSGITGLSSALIGSGMVFPFKLIKQIMTGIDAVGGFDKVLQLELIERGYKIFYLEEAVLFDEKINTLHDFKKQRKRWISSQYKYFLKNFQKSFQMLFRGNFDYFHLAVFHNLFPNRLFGFALLAVFALIYGLGISFLHINFMGYLILLVAYMIALFIAIPRYLYTGNLLRSILYLPVISFQYFTGMFRIISADRKFLHTKHFSTEINNPLYRE